jgi:site-specific recombinase XerD
MTNEPGKTTALARVGPSAIDLPALVERTKETGRRSKAKSTREAYELDWDAFSVWCKWIGTSSLPASPETIATYLQYLSETPPKKHPERARGVSTIARALAAICYEHREAGFDPPPSSSKLVRDTMVGLRNTLGVAPKRKAAVRGEHILAMLAKTPETLAGLRDRAILLLGFLGAFRRSELVKFNVEDLEYLDKGMIVTVRRAKQDQEGKGREVGILKGRVPSVCAMYAVQTWLEAAGITKGRVFRAINKHWQVSEEPMEAPAVALIVKKYAEAIGLSRDAVAGHSLRAGFVTSAAARKSSGTAIRGHTGHETPKMTDIYTRKASIFEDNPTEGLL